MDFFQDHVHTTLDPSGSTRNPGTIAGNLLHGIIQIFGEGLQAPCENDTVHQDAAPHWKRPTVRRTFQTDS
jgi:hypothetical protein